MDTNAPRSITEPMGAASEFSAGLGVTDIVERLRESNNDTEYVSPIGTERRLTLAWEAAAEIERLRAAIQAAAEQIRRCDYIPARSTLLMALKTHNVMLATNRRTE